MIPAMPESRTLPLHRWIIEGLRAGALLCPRVGDERPTPLQLAAIVALAGLIEIALGRFEIAGDAHFDLRGWLAPWWSTAAILLLAWWVLPVREEGGSPRGLASWFLLWTVAMVPINFIAQAINIALAQDAVPEGLFEGDWRPWLIYGALWLWALTMTARLASSFDVRPRASAALTAGFAVLFGVAAWQFPDRPWQSDTPVAALDGKPRLVLSQDIFEVQQGILRQAAASLAAERPGVVDAYGIVFSPYAQEDVFLNEGNMVTRVLEERFDAAGRVIQLANHATTADSLAWATPANLDHAIAAIGEKMDRERDVLFIYMTSHGARDFKLEASNPPLQVDTVSPGELRQALDNAGIRNRVIVVSACYAGGWVGPIADDNTLVMTAADATHTSFGCGVGSELTFFGRALFDEELRRTHSLEKAFAAAVPVIRKREEDARKADGFSNPQIQVGDKLRPVLRELEQRLDSSPK
jgi:hypothetical protein